MTLVATKRAQARAGFTLLEVLLASAIGVMLLGGLYVAVDVQFRQTHAARRSGEQSSVARGVLAKITTDINDSLAPVLSTVVTNSAATTGGTAAASSTTGAAGAGAAPAAAAPAAGGTAAAPAGNVIVFNTGIQGDSQNIIITSSRVPHENLTVDAMVNGNQTYGTSDLRKVMYWLPGGGDSGLARYEMKTETSLDEAGYCVLPPAVPDEMSYIFAPEIKSIQFSYFDGTNWQDSWDSTIASTAANSDGVTAQGPPVAIAIVIGIQSDDPDQQESKSNSSLGGGNGIKMYRRVIAIPTANGATITAAPAPTGQ